jgi:uncharacterized protein (TIGR02246 family)
MPDASTATGDALADRAALVDVMTRYACTVDRRDLAAYATCFTEDVHVTGYSAGAIEGRDAFLAYVERALTRYAATHHAIVNHEIAVDGDTATMRSHVTATHVLADDDEALVVLWAVYDDDLVRTADGWRIRRHHLDRRIEPRRLHGPRV